MCFGPELLLLGGSVAASAGGKMLSNSENAANDAAIARAKNQALEDNLRRQKTFSDENANTLSAALSKFSPEAQTGDATAAADKRTTAVTANMQAPDSAGAAVPIVSDTPNTVKDSIAARMAAAFTKSTDAAKASAKLGSYNDVWANNGFGVTDAGRKVDTVNNFSRGQTALLPSMQDLAGYSANRPSSGMGDVLSGLGQLGAMYAGGGKFPMMGGASPSGVLPGGLPLGYGGIGRA